MVGGILAVVSLVLLANIYTVGVVKEETLLQGTPKLGSFVRQSRTQKKPVSVQSNGVAMGDRRMEDHDDVFEDPVGTLKDLSPSSSGMASNLDTPTPQRQLLDNVDTNPAKKEDPDQKKSRAYFIKRGDQFYVTSRDALDLHERLPAETYSIGINPMSGEFFLQSIDSFDIHGKIYGDTKRQASRILQTFMDRHGSTGVLLSGEKVSHCLVFYIIFAAMPLLATAHIILGSLNSQGSGKTFLAKYIAIQAAKDHGIPTVVVNQPLHGERFNAFIQSIQQPTIFLFDEFEKIYAEKDPQIRAREAEMEMMGHHSSRHGGNMDMNMGNYNQDSMLTLLDGTYSTKMLFILTTNNKYKVSNHMRNRPGRIFYVIDFAGLPADFIKEYCNDKLKDKTKIPQVLAVSGLFEAFSFDMLQAMVEEMNRYGETPEQVLDFLNVRPEFTSGTRYLVKLIVDGNEIPNRHIHSGKHWFGNPLVSVVQVYYEKPRPRNKRSQNMPPEPPAMMEEMLEEDEEGDRGGEIEFTANDIDGMDATTSSFSYWNEAKKARLVLTKDGSMMSSGQSNGSLLQKLSQLGATDGGGSAGIEE